MTEPTPEERRRWVAETIADLWPHRMSNEAAKQIDNYYMNKVSPHLAAQTLRRLADETDRLASAGADGEISPAQASAWLRQRADLLVQ